jgi:hypothetical protein
VRLLQGLVGETRADHHGAQDEQALLLRRCHLFTLRRQVHAMTGEAGQDARGGRRRERRRAQQEVTRLTLRG